MTWKEWKQRYPAGVVANGSPELRARPHGAEAGGHIGDAELPPPFAATANLTDHRLETHELILGIRVAETEKSYAIPVRTLAPYPNLFTVPAGSKRVLIARDGEFAMAAFDLASTPYTNGGFSITSTNPLTFKSPDGASWNAFGVSLADSKVKLPPTRSYLTEWYEWVSHSRESEIIDKPEVATGRSGR
jgi:hypothetical protein